MGLCESVRNRTRVYENHIKVYKIVYKCTRLLDGIAFSGTAFSRAGLSGNVFIPVILFFGNKRWLKEILWE